MHAAEVNNKPSLGLFTITDLPADIVGKKLRVKVQVTNVAGLAHASDKVLLVTIAGKPGTPALGPSSITSITTTDLIALQYAEPTDTGGSPITNFEVQMDDGIGGGFTTVAGGELALY